MWGDAELFTEGEVAGERPRCVCTLCDQFSITCRSNVIQNIHAQYLKTGYIWEQYTDDLGTGKV